MAWMLLVWLVWNLKIIFSAVMSNKIYLKESLGGYSILVSFLDWFLVTKIPGEWRNAEYLIHSNRDSFIKFTSSTSSAGSILEEEVFWSSTLAIPTAKMSDIKFGNFVSFPTNIQQRVISFWIKKVVWGELLIGYFLLFIANFF